MGQTRETLLNGLLAAMVVLSVALSAQVWFPDQPVQGGTKQPSVQISPPSQEGTMPKTFRPERIYVRQPSGRIALLPAGSVAYKQVWWGMESILTGMSALPAPPQTEEELDPGSEVVTLILPMPLTMEQWAQQFKWNTAGLRTFSMKVDRITLRLGPSAILYLTGPAGGMYRIGPVAASELLALKEVLAGLNAQQFMAFRPLQLKDSLVRVAAGLQVPDITGMPSGSLEVHKPDNAEEEARFLPDLTVVRRIDEKDARSFTDGLRLLRITRAGQLEYLSVQVGGSPIAPDMQRALRTAEDWVSAHGGWPQELIMRGVVQQPGSTSLIFDLRMDGVFPVETAGGALRVNVTSYRDSSGLQHSAVTQFRRLPDFAPFFGRARRPVITPERAVQLAAEKFAALLYNEELREVHPAYLVRWTTQAGGDWALEPVWVLHAGEETIYVQAAVTLDSEPFEPFMARP